MLLFVAIFSVCPFNLCLGLQFKLPMNKGQNFYVKAKLPITQTASFLAFIITLLVKSDSVSFDNENGENNGSDEKDYYLCFLLTICYPILFTFYVSRSCSQLYKDFYSN